MDPPVCLTDHVLHLTDELGIGASPLSDALWKTRERPEVATGRLVSLFEYDATWNYQERHPDGDELVFVIAGDVDLLVDTGSGEQSVHVAPGCAGIVPAGGWHRLAVREPCRVLFITPTPARTEHRECSGR